MGFPSRSIDALLQSAAEWTPREATSFLLAFDRRFRAETGGAATHVEKIILTSLLRERARLDS